MHAKNHVRLVNQILQKPGARSIFVPSAFIGRIKVTAPVSQT